MVNGDFSMYNFMMSDKMVNGDFLMYDFMMRDKERRHKTRLEQRRQKQLAAMRRFFLVLIWIAVIWMLTAAHV